MVTVTPGIRNRETCKNKTHPIFIPQKHQQFVLDYFPFSKYKGLLLYHKLGSGKTCTSIMIGDKMLQDKQIKKVYVITPGSLRKNWLDEYCKKCGLNSDFLKKNFTFITYNYNISEAITKLDFNNSLIIIDEAHNLINGVKNLSKNPLTLYNKIINSNCRVLVLTGTVIFNNIYEWCLMINLLKDNICKDVIVDGIFDPNKYNESLLSSENLEGIISYFPGEEGYFPDIVYNQPINILMSYEQELKYKTVYQQERILRAKGPPGEDLLNIDPEEYKKQYELYIMANKYILSRSVSNFYYPLDLKKIPDLPVKEGGWISHKILENRELFDIMSPKFTALFVNILSNFNSKQVVFSFFKDKSGVLTIHSLLKLCGIKTKLFTGDMTDIQRSKILNEFNSPDNRYGEKIKLLLLTEAGVEGITLLEVEHVHLLESSITPNKTIQAIARTVRYKSHIDLPKERQVVNVWKYHSITGRTEYGFEDTTPKMDSFEEYYNYLIINGMKKVNIERKAVDSVLDEKGEIKADEFYEFYKILQKNSIENGNIIKKLKN
jgi:superfamily II DNA or RNA helicase